MTSQTSDQQLDDVVAAIREFRAQALATAEATRTGHMGPTIKIFSTYCPRLMNCPGTNCLNTSLRATCRHPYSKSARCFRSVRSPPKGAYTRRSPLLSLTMFTFTNVKTWQLIHFRPKGTAMDSPLTSIPYLLFPRSPPKNVPNLTAARTTNPRILLLLRPRCGNSDIPSVSSLVSPLETGGYWKARGTAG